MKSLVTRSFAELMRAADRQQNLQPGEMIPVQDLAGRNLDVTPPQAAASIRLPAGACDTLHDSKLADELRGFIEDHRRPSAFLYAVLSNDLRGACELATRFDAHRLPDYINWLLQHAPERSWGDENTVRMWLAPQIVHALQLRR